MVTWILVLTFRTKKWLFVTVCTFMTAIIIQHNNAERKKKFLTYYTQFWSTCNQTKNHQWIWISKALDPSSKDLFLNRKKEDVDSFFFTFVSHLFERNLVSVFSVQFSSFSATRCRFFSVKNNAPVHSQKELLSTRNNPHLVAPF